MKLRFLYFILGSTIGFTAGAFIYSNVFDPERYWANAKIMALEISFTSCNLGKKLQKSCKSIVDDIKSDLDGIKTK